MLHVESRRIDYLIVGAIVLLVVASLPFLAFLALTLRGVLLLAVVAALVCGLIAYAVSRAFRDWFEAYSEPQIGYKGLQLATDVVFHPSHSWARMEGEVVVGVDDLIQATLGPIEDVELPPNGRRIRQGDRLFRLRRGDRIVDVCSPISGTVLGGNPALREQPELINHEPFAKGWAVRLQSDFQREDRRLLLRGRKARAWFRSAVDCVVGLLSDKTATAVLPDGGVLVGQLYRHIDDAAWRRLTATAFTAPSTDLDPRN